MAARQEKDYLERSARDRQEHEARVAQLAVERRAELAQAEQDKEAAIKVCVPWALQRIAQRIARRGVARGVALRSCSSGCGKRLAPQREEDRALEAQRALNARVETLLGRIEHHEEAESEAMRGKAVAEAAMLELQAQLTRTASQRKVRLRYPVVVEPCTAVSLPRSLVCCALRCQAENQASSKQITELKQVVAKMVRSSEELQSRAGKLVAEAAAQSVAVVEEAALTNTKHEAQVAKMKKLIASLQVCTAGVAQRLGHAYLPPHTSRTPPCTLRSCCAARSRRKSSFKARWWRALRRRRPPPRSWSKPAARSSAWLRGRMRCTSRSRCRNRCPWTS